MGSITRGLSNNITTGGVILPAGITNASVSAVTSFANASGGTLILLSTQTASASATISFTTGLDSTYDEYIFKFINVRPTSGTAQKFTFNFSTCTTFETNDLDLSNCISFSTELDELPKFRPNPSKAES